VTGHKAPAIFGDNILNETDLHEADSKVGTSESGRPARTGTARAQQAGISLPGSEEGVSVEVADAGAGT
jgi:hypothetical protein